MIIVKEQATNRVTHCFESGPVQIDEGGILTAPGLRAANMPLSDYAIVEDVPAPPVDFIGLQLIYDGLWSVIDQAEYDAAWESLHPPQMPPPVPEFVSMAKARKALLLNGITADQVVAAINAIPDETEAGLALIDWEYENQVRRESPLVESLGPALNLTSEQIDQMFIQAESL